MSIRSALRGLPSWPALVIAPLIVLGVGALHYGPAYRQCSRLAEARERGLSQVRTPRSWYITSDAIMDFIRINDLDDVMEQKFKDITQVRREYPNLIQLFKNSTFPPEVLAELRAAVDRVRSGA